MSIIRILEICLFLGLAAMNFVNGFNRWDPFATFYDSGKIDIIMGIYWILAALFCFYLFAVEA